MQPIGLLFVLMALVLGGCAVAYAITLGRRGVEVVRQTEQPAWPRYHVRFYLVALLFLAFDMEMAYMYPWAAVFRSMGVFAYAEIGFFLTVLGLGILYAWREGALDWS